MQETKKVFKLQNQRKSQKKISEDEAYNRIILLVAQHYNQYTIEQLKDEIPFKQVKMMAKEINRRRAETLLLLNGIINGPNSKSKSHSEFKSIIKELSEELEK